jgi:hypothetical protein
MGPRLLLVLSFCFFFFVLFSSVDIVRTQGWCQCSRCCFDRSTTQCSTFSVIGSFYDPGCQYCDKDLCGAQLPPSSSCNQYRQANYSAACAAAPAGTTGISIFSYTDNACKTPFGVNLYTDLSVNECVMVGSHPTQILSCYNGEVTVFSSNTQTTCAGSTPTVTVKSGSCFVMQGFSWNITCPSALVPGVSSSSTGPGSPSSATTLSVASVGLSVVLLLLVLVML